MKDVAKIDTGLILKPVEIKPDSYRQYFIDFCIGEFLFEAIDPLFIKLLEEETHSMGTVVLPHKIDPENYPISPTEFLSGDAKNPSTLCLSPREIFWYFLQHQEKLAIHNFFLLKNNDPKDLRIVNIEFLGKNNGIDKYFLYLYLFSHWEILGRKIKGKSLSFVTAFV